MLALKPDRLQFFHSCNLLPEGAKVLGEELVEVVFAHTWNKPKHVF